MLRMSSADYTYPKMREHSIPNSHPHISELGYHSETVRVLHIIINYCHRFFRTFLLLVAIFIIIILEVPRISVLMPAELTPNNFLFCSKALKFGILYQTQSLRFLHCNRLKRKFLIFYYIDNASCTVRCCVLL